MIEDAKEKIEGLDDNNTWLFEHMIIAFWHGFGIANGLSIKKEDVETIRYKEGPNGYRVKAEVMQEKLREYLRWLEQYQKSWDTQTSTWDEPSEQQEITRIRQKMYDSEHGWGNVTRMIELLQI